MNFQYRPTMDVPDPNPNSLHLLHQPNPHFSYFTQQAIRVGLGNGDPRSREFGYPASSMYMKPSIEREMEKERIRAEIIAEDLMRRRILEEEVRREMMMDRTFMVRHSGGSGAFIGGGSFGPMYRLPPPFLTDFKHCGRFEDMASPARRVEVRSEFEALPFQRSPFVAGGGSSSGVRLQEIKVNGVVAPAPAPEDEKVIILAKPSTNLADIKRKAMAPTASSAVEVVKKQRTDEDLSCSLCQVSATSKQGLNDHLQGKKHVARVRGLATQRMGFGTGPLSQTININRGRSIKVLSGETDAESSFGTVHNAQTRKTINTAENAPFSSNEPVVDKKQKGVVKSKCAKPQRKFRYFCEKCQVGAYAQKVFNKHIQGRRHQAKLSKASKVNRAAGVKASVQGGKIENEEAHFSAEETVEGNAAPDGDANPECDNGDQVAETLGDETTAPKTTDQGPF